MTDKFRRKLRDDYVPKYAQSYYSSVEHRVYGDGPETKLGAWVHSVDLDQADSAAWDAEQKRRQDYKAEREAIRWKGLTRDERIAELSFEKYANDPANLAIPCRREYIRKNYQELEIKRLGYGNRSDKGSL